MRVGLLHLFGVLALAGWIALAFASKLSQPQLPIFLFATTWAWMIFLATWRVCQHEGRTRLLPWLFAWAVAFRVVGLFATPVLEDDHFRFLWDGRQTALTGNPYASSLSDFNVSR